MIERIDRSRVAGTSEEAVTKHIESDFKIRRGLCPNDCGLMHPIDYGQECAKCGFSCNRPAESDTTQ